LDWSERESRDSKAHPLAGGITKPSKQPSQNEKKQDRFAQVPRPARQKDINNRPPSNPSRMGKIPKAANEQTKKKSKAIDDSNLQLEALVYRAQLKDKSPEFAPSNGKTGLHESGPPTGAPWWGKKRAQNSPAKS